MQQQQQQDEIECEFSLPRAKLDQSVVHISTNLQTAKNAFSSDRTKSLKFRRRQLKSLLKLYNEHETEMIEALKEDLQRPALETVIFEIEFLKNDLLNVLKNFEDWAVPESRAKRMMNFFDDLKVYKDPYGVVLVIGAWNYPLQSSLLPLHGAIAAGNCVMVKPSLLSKHSAEFMQKYISNYLDAECYQVINEDVDYTQYDYIFYTGQVKGAKVVQAAASQKLIPTTLVLGGKNPVYLDKTANIELAAKRILWGKCVNAGQTCIGPEYVLCTKEVQQKFIKAAKTVLTSFYGNDVQKSPDFGRMLNDDHFNRVLKLMSNKNAVYGGSSDPITRFIHPTILADVSPNDAIMHEEIYGPLLPIITISNLDEAIAFINAREKPLSMYIFSKNSKDVDKMLLRTSAGGVTVNDTLLHIAAESLPFGGVGMSGNGNYHGKASFDTFVHEKSVMKKSLNPLVEKIQTMRYPPYKDFKRILMVATMRKRGEFPFGLLKYLFVFILGIVFTLILSNFFDI